MKNFPAGWIMACLALLCMIPSIIQLKQTEPPDSFTNRTSGFVIKANYVPYPYGSAAYSAAGAKAVFLPGFYFGRMYVQYMFSVDNKTFRVEQESLPFLFFLSFYPKNVAAAIKDTHVVVAYDPTQPQQAKLVNLISVFTNLAITNGVALYFITLIPVTLQAMLYESGSNPSISPKSNEDDPISPQL